MSKLEGLLNEAQKKLPTGGFSEKQSRLGAFKVDAELLKMMKREAGHDPDKLLFRKVRDHINALPHNELPKIWGKDNMADAQDVIAGKPRQAFQMFLRNIQKVSPKLAQYLRKVPDNAALVFYGVMLKVSGKDMANLIFNRYFTTDEYYKPKKKQEETMSKLNMLLNNLLDESRNR